MFSQITAQQTWSHIISQQEYCIQCTERGVLLPQQLICSWGPLCKIIRPCISNNLMLMKLLCDESRPLWMRHCHPWGLHSLPAILHSLHVHWCFASIGLYLMHPKPFTIGSILLLDTCFAYTTHVRKKQSEAWLIRLYDHNSRVLCTTSVAKRTFLCVIRG